MSVPHIDSRMINGEKSIVVWAFCRVFFNAAILEEQFLFRFTIVKTDNIFPMISAGIKNIHTKYLIDQVRQQRTRINALRGVPEASSKDWVVKEQDKGTK
jgi:malate dehydrogenase (quinone)